MRIINDKPEIWPFILVSLMLHILLVLLLRWTWLAPEFKEDVVEIIPLFEKGQKYRIADISKPKVEKKPDKAKFLGMHDSSVKKETVSTFRRLAKPGKPGQPKKSIAKRSVKKKKQDKNKLYKFDKRALNKAYDKGKRGQNGKRGDDFPHDYFPDFRRGNKTYLNVLRYPSIDYFVRMKRAFRVTFNPVPSLRGQVNRISRGSVEVVLGVSVNSAGNLAELFIFRSSGLSTYDEEALRTIRASAPFSSPPKKFVESDGMLRMSWTFTVYL